MTLESTEEGSSLIGRFGLNFGAAKDWIFNLQLKSPVNSGSGEVTQVDLDGLAGDTVATLSLSKRWETFRDEPTDPTERESWGYTGVCNAYNDALWSGFLAKRENFRPIDDGRCDEAALDDRGNFWEAKANEAKKKAALAACRAFNAEHTRDKVFIGSRLPSAVQKTGLYSYDLCSVPWAERNDPSWASRLAEALEPVCKEYNETPEALAIPTERGVDECRFAALKARGPALETKALQAAEVRLWYLTLEASGSDEDFKFFEGDELVETQRTEHNASYGLALGLFDRGHYWSLAYRNRRTFRGGSPTEVCRPLGDTESLRCDNLVLTEPERTDQEVVQLDYKRLVNPRLGLNTRLIHDLESEVWNPHLLLFFLQKKDTGLNGGIDLSYTDSDEADDRFTARVFIGTTFELFPE